MTTMKTKTTKEARTIPDSFVHGLLLELISSIWTIQGLQLDILRDKINYLLKTPNEAEIRMLTWLYGEREADRIIHAAHLRNRKSSKSKKEKKKKETFVADINATIENNERGRWTYQNGKPNNTGRLFMMNTTFHLT